ncbi:uncharacterized protein LOC110460595 [Mizuhopecten yessoensis]|uniref:Serine/threonine-protein kinase PknL n=1 Tax=Mizuhopecten yessoensis TaxID=6573 RepID=A0A210Q200_MIZYE|nr:uncharacterized protein LOC110460595 [Mizuhopecten yessoensis]OWF42783.1 Serine/threonine-protein kinase PknL [Mizuhopecten yessoensis]
MAGITEADILNSEEFDDIFEYADKLGVPLDGLDALEDMQERLVMQLKKNEFGNPKAWIAKSLEVSQKEDTHKRLKIGILLEEFQKCISECQNGNGIDAIEDLLRTEGTVRDLKQELGQHIERMKKGDCVFVVAGETSAGKSSLLNLLLGQPILPSFTGSSTSVITRISYGKKMNAEIVYQESGTPTEKFDNINMEWAHEFLWDRLRIKDENKRQTQSHIKEIRFQVPCEVLRCGIVIVDSPGIGENEAMDSVIADFIRENEIMGYIYVIKSDNSGGVDEDRFLCLLKMVIDKQKMNQQERLEHFDSKSAMFVCNRWDLVKSGEQDLVFNNTVKLLRECWPSLATSQVIRFKTEYAIKEAECDPDFIPELYRVFLECLRDMYIHAMDHRIQQTYKWMDEVFTRSIFQLQALLAQVNMSEKERIEKVEDIKKKLHTLESKSYDVINSLKEDVEQTSNELCEEFRPELMKPYSKISLTKWLPEELPQLDDRGWPYLKMNLRWKIAERVIRLIEEWESEKGKIAVVEERTANVMKFQLNLLQAEMKKIEDGMNAKESCTREKLRRSISNPLTLRRMSRVSISEQQSSDRATPLKLITRVLHPVQNVVDNIRSTKLIDKYILAKKEKKYKENPSKIAREQTEKFIQELMEPQQPGEDILQQIISNLLERSMSQLAEIERNIPSLIKSNEMLLDRALSFQKNIVESKGLYENLNKSLEGTKRRLDHYYKGYISVKNMREVDICTPVENGRRRSRSFRASEILHTSFFKKSADKPTSEWRNGLWTVVKRGQCNKCDITMKMYLPSSRIDTTYNEVAKLRFLNEKTMAVLEGIHYSDAPPPVFIFQDHLYTLAERLPCWPSSTKCNKLTVIKQIIDGLCYLHKHKLVHMELCLDTVTVSRDGEVKLVGGCLPREFVQPSETELVGNFAYLSPNVLRGSTYSNASDMYGLGLLVFELLLGVTAFRSHRETLLLNFIKNVDPLTMVDPADDLQRLSCGTAEFIRSCLSPTKEDMFPCAGDIQKALECIGQENLEIVRENPTKYSLFGEKEER